MCVFSARDRLGIHASFLPPALDTRQGASEAPRGGTSGGTTEGAACANVTDAVCQRGLSWRCLQLPRGLRRGCENGSELCPIANFVAWLPCHRARRRRRHVSINGQRFVSDRQQRARWRESQLPPSPESAASCWCWCWASTIAAIPSFCLSWQRSCGSAASESRHESSARGSDATVTNGGGKWSATRAAEGTVVERWRCNPAVGSTWFGGEGQWSGVAVEGEVYFFCYLLLRCFLKCATEMLLQYSFSYLSDGRSFRYLNLILFVASTMIFSMLWSALSVVISFDSRAPRHLSALDVLLWVTLWPTWPIQTRYALQWPMRHCVS